MSSGGKGLNRHAEKLIDATKKLRAAISRRKDLRKEKYQKWYKRCASLRTKLEEATVKALDSGDADGFEYLANAMHAASCVIQDFDKAISGSGRASGKASSSRSSSIDSGAYDDGDDENVRDDDYDDEDKNDAPKDNWACFDDFPDEDEHDSDAARGSGAEPLKTLKKSGGVQKDSHAQNANYPHGLEADDAEDYYNDSEAADAANVPPSKGRNVDFADYTKSSKTSSSKRGNFQQYGDLLPSNATVSPNLSSVKSVEKVVPTLKLVPVATIDRRYMSLLEKCLERLSLDLWKNINDKDLNLRCRILENYLLEEAEPVSFVNEVNFGGPLQWRDRQVLTEPLWRVSDDDAGLSGYMGRFISGDNLLIEASNFNLYLETNVDSNRGIILASFTLVPNMQGIDCFLQLGDLKVVGLQAIGTHRKNNYSLEVKLTSDPNASADALGASKWPRLVLLLLESDGTRFQFEFLVPLGVYQYLVPNKLTLQQFNKLWSTDQYAQTVQVRWLQSKQPLNVCDLVAPTSTLFATELSKERLFLSASTPNVLVLVVLWLQDPCRIVLEVATPCMQMQYSVQSALKEILANHTNKVDKIAKVTLQNGTKLPAKFAQASLAP